jgi:hypothetical protein
LMLASGVVAARAGAAGATTTAAATVNSVRTFARIAAPQPVMSGLSLAVTRDTPQRTGQAVFSVNRMTGISRSVLLR